MTKSADQFDSLQLAKLWTDLDHIRSILNSSVLPLLTHLEVEDSVLYSAAEGLTEAISQHFKKYYLQAMVAWTSVADR